MLRRCLVSCVLMGTIIGMPIQTIAAEESSAPYKATVSKTGVNEQARQEAYNEYTSPSLENYTEFKPLFKDWYGRKALKVVTDVGNKLIVANNIDKFVRFEVSRKQVVNASADFHGVIRVYNGLLDYVETEDELAYVLGHELGHIYYDDSKKSRIRYGVTMAAAIMAGVAVGASSNSRSGAGAAGVTALSGSLVNRKITKRTEARADIAGIDFMTRAGYNPMAAISMMNKILNRRWDGLSDHPSGDKRLMAAYHYIAKTYPKYLVVGYDTVSFERAMNYIGKELKKEKNSSISTKESETEKNMNDSAEDYAD